MKRRKLVDKRGVRVSSHTKVVSFVLKPINGILQPSSKLLQILMVILNSLGKTCQLMLS